MLFQIKRNWDVKFKYALWDDMVTRKKSIGKSPFQIIYGVDAFFPVQLSFPVINFLQDEAEEPDEMKRRIFQIVKLQQEREAIVEKVEIYRKRVKECFDKKVKTYIFSVGDAVLRWDARNDEKGKHEKFDNLWLGPFTIIMILGNITFVLQNLHGDEIVGPVNGRFLKYFHTY